jgi:hypothetical protein
MTTVCRTFLDSGAMVLAATVASPQSAHHGRATASDDGIQSQMARLLTLLDHR